MNSYLLITALLSCLFSVIECQYYKAGLNGNKYILYHTQTTFEEAIQRCNDTGAKLAYHDKQGENRIMQGLMQSGGVQSIWVGRGQDQTGNEYNSSVNIGLGNLFNLNLQTGLPKFKICFTLTTGLVGILAEEPAITCQLKKPFICELQEKVEGKQNEVTQQEKQ